MKSNIFKKAHELTKKIIKAGDDYRATFRLCLSFVYSQIKKGVNEMLELIGTEKQVKWASDLRDMVLEYANKCLKKDLEKRERMMLKGKPTPKTNAKIEKEIAFIKRVENEDSAKKIIDEFNFMTNRYSSGFYKGEILDTIIYNLD